MNVTVSGRHMNVSDSLKRYCLEKAENSPCNWRAKLRSICLFAPGLWIFRESFEFDRTDSAILPMYDRDCDVGRPAKNQWNRRFDRTFRTKSARIYLYELQA